MIPDPVQALIAKRRETAEVLARASGNPRNGQAENDRMTEGSMTLDRCAEELADTLAALVGPPEREPEYVECPSCDGSGRWSIHDADERTCLACGGSGEVEAPLNDAAEKL